MKGIDYRINKSSETQIREHLKDCSKDFVPPLNTYVDINTYSKKLKNKATCIEAYHQNALVGIIAVYYNTAEKSAFITNLSIECSFSNKGIAKNLINLCLDIGSLLKLDYVELEVHKSNLRAIRFYEKALFTIHSENFAADKIVMKRKI